MATASQKNVWGPITWAYLHLLTFLYPSKPTEKDKAQIKKNFQDVAESLPCENCKSHFSEELKNIDKHNNSMNQLSQWLVEVHNSVNKRLNKPLKNYKDVAKLYKCDEVLCPVTAAPAPASSPASPASPSSQFEQECWLWLIAIALCVILLLFICRKKR